MRLTLFAVPLVVAACSSSGGSTSPASAAGGDGGVAGGDDGGSFQHDIVLSMSLNVPAGKELHQCQYVKAPTTADVQIGALSHQYTPGSHHFLVWDTDLNDIPADMTGQQDCTNGDEKIYEHTRGFLYGAQVPTGSVVLPSGVGYKLPAGHVVMLNVHFLNATTRDIASTASVGLDLAKGAVTTAAGFLLFYDPFIDLPAHGKATTGMRCAVPSDVTLLTGFSHYHQRGTAMKAYDDPSMTAQATDTVYASHDWEHPDGITPGTVLRAGTVFRFGCDYDNTQSDTEIFQGPNVQTSEMCVFAGMYYPRDAEFEQCAKASFVGFGTKACGDLEPCVSQCPPGDAPQFSGGGPKVGPCWERCIASGCDGATDALLPLVGCIGQNCQQACGQDKSACNACAQAKCGQQAQACAAQACK